jgi:EmrB/QacA subfamily drug resistance transporter
MCFALVLVIGALAMLYVALPAIAADLGASQSEQQWIVDAYVVLLAGLLLPAGAIGDRYGRRGALLAGITIFGVACAFAAMATSPGPLIFWRALAGVGAALVMPGTLATITSVFPEEERAKAVGIWVGFAGGGAVIGMVTAGALLESFWWGSAFLVVAGSVGVAFLATLVTVPKTSNPEDANIDPVGSVLSFVAIASLVFAIIEGPVHGWGSGLSVGGFAAAAAAGAGFSFWERHTPTPLLDPRLFADRGFASGAFTLTLLFLVMFGFFLVILQYLQLVAGHDALEAALMLIPTMVVMLLLSTAAAPLSERFGMRVVSGVGLLVGAAALVALTALGTESTYPAMLPALMAIGAGIALAMTPGTNAIVAALPPEKQGVASAVNDAAREIGSALGIAILGSAFNAGYRHDIADAVSGLPAEATDVIKGSPAGAMAVAGQLGPAGAAVVSAAREAFVAGMQAAFLVGAALLAAGAGYVWFFAPGRRPAQADPSAGPEPSVG